MPDHAIVDAHVHLWDPRRLRIPWLDGNELLDQSYGLDEYQAHTAGLEVAAMVYLQVDVDPAYALIEAHDIARLADRDPRLQAIVAWAPLEHGEHARSFLDALTAIDQRIRGVRRILQGEADPAFCLRPDFVRGVELLADYGLSFDICINHTQLAAAVELVRRCPQVNFMLDHIAKPDIRGGRLDPWRADMQALAELPNVMCKISGVVTEADHTAWKVDRVAFGGDWPVVLLASNYRRWVEALDTLTSSYSPEARRKLWVENARRFYRLP